MVQIIIFTCFRIEHMNDHIAVIQQNPALGVESFSAQGLNPLLFHLEFHFLGKTPHLSGGRTSSYDKIIGQNGQIPYLQNLQALCLALIKNMRNFSCKLDALHV
ncbi:hypothetical protein EVA_09137 [gut metagenome]|uniref:Uncharacterized protein n=1 Tax=gut metagenome TaxID=749906 RepID=J9GKV0_9ZZZZ